MRKNQKAYEGKPMKRKSRTNLISLIILLSLLFYSINLEALIYPIDDLEKELPNNPYFNQKVAYRSSNDLSDDELIQNNKELTKRPFLTLKGIKHVSDDELLQIDNVLADEELLTLDDYRPDSFGLISINRHVTFFAERAKKSFSTILMRSSKYLPIMRNILAQNNLPQDLVYVPFIESGFNLYAKSPANAVGPWQFIASTAVKYGLKINSWVD
ncbi:Lytic transglycosylase catalytic, partial [Candidatus Magnetoovum chiemensis]